MSLLFKNHTGAGKLQQNKNRLLNS